MPIGMTEKKSWLKMIFLYVSRFKHNGQKNVILNLDGKLQFEMGFVV